MSTDKMVEDARNKAEASSVRRGAPRRSARRRLSAHAGAQVADILDEELTPRVRSVVFTLIDEVERLRRDLEQSQRRMVELASMADTDPLLGIFNRRAFGRELDRAIAYARRYGTTLSVIYFDLDDFKLVNDNHGHAAGDVVLRLVGQTLDANVRRSDLVGRLGGDEFAVALVRTGYDNAVAKAAQLLEAIATRRLQMPADLPEISLTVGVAEFAEGDSVERLLARADEAMYSGKGARQRA